MSNLRLALRMMLKTRGPSLLSVLALGMGMGLTTMMFSIVWGAFLRGLPFEEGHRIVYLGRTTPATEAGDDDDPEVTLHDYLDWRSQQRSFTDLGAYYTGTVNLSGTGRPERYDGAFITANTFDILRVRPFLGRAFQPDEDQPAAPPVAILGYRLWQDRFGGDPGILGRTLRANGRVSTIVGVMPERFGFPGFEALWLPLGMDPLVIDRGKGTTLEVFGRLRDGVSLDEAQVELSAIADRLALEYPATNEGIGARLSPYTEGAIGREPVALLYTMLGAVFCILLIACANVANLLLGRVSFRGKEIAIRSSLGATRGRVVLQFLAESLVLAAVATLLGLIVAKIGIDAFNRAIAVSQPPAWIEIKLDPAALAFTAGLTLIATLLAGGLPAFQAARADVNALLKDESRGSSSFRMGRLSKGLVVLEIALSCALLVAAGLMIKSVVKLRTVDLGFSTEDVFTARIGLPEADYPDSAAQRRFVADLLPRLRSIPGIESIALMTSLPGLFAGSAPVAIEGTAYNRPQDRPEARTVLVSEGFFETFQTSLREGREFSAADRDGALPVAIANESFARRHFGAESPLGRRIRIEGEEDDGPWRTIVGVVPDLAAGGIDDDAPEALYLPFAQGEARFLSVAARTRGNPGAITGQVRDAVSAIDPDLPIYFVETLASRMARAYWFYGVFGTLFAVFGVVALFLGAVGLYGVMSFAVTQRTREVGVRMALGAQARDVLRLIFRQGMLQLAVGLALGLGLAATFSHFLKIVLFSVEPRDPLVFGAIVLVLGTAAALACFVPARRATRVDPIEALRYE